MAFFVWAIACVLVSKAYGARHHNTEMEDTDERDRKFLGKADGSVNF